MVDLFYLKFKIFDNRDLFYFARKVLCSAAQ